MGRTFNFLGPSLQAGTLLDISIPESSTSSSTSVVRSLPVGKGEYQSVGSVKRICSAPEGSVVLVDDAYRISTLNTRPQDGDWTPEVVGQSKVAHTSGDVWTGLSAVNGGSIASLSSGRLTYHRIPGSTEEGISEHQTYIAEGPVLALASSSKTSTTFAIAGKDLDVSIRDIERTFASSSKTQPEGKRRKTELVEGEIWRAKNMPNTSLQLRPPIHHLSLTYLPLPSSTSADDPVSSYTQLVSGTKTGTLRRYDTRQKKPVGEYELAREGGIGALAPVNENEIFFADRGNFIGCADLRTGKLLYSYPGLTSSAHHLLYIPPYSTSSTDSNDRQATPGQVEGDTPSEGYLASISPDATLRLHSTVPPRREGQKGNPQGGKARVVGMAGGVGLGSLIFTGLGHVPESAGAENGEESGMDDEDEEVWDDLDEVDDDDGSVSDDEY